nr:MAG TPA: hypothetical protein [Caudoviricetes sp.]
MNGKWYSIERENRQRTISHRGYVHWQNHTGPQA